MSQMEQSELSDARRIFISELDQLRRENAKLYERNFQLRNELKDKETIINIMKAQFVRQADQLKKLKLIDDHPEAGPA